MTDLLLRHLHQANTDNLTRYRTPIRRQRDLRSSAIFVNNDSGQPVAGPGVNTAVTTGPGLRNYSASSSATASRWLEPVPRCQ
jgi:predicted transcriptional regulator YheO